MSKIISAKASKASKTQTQDIVITKATVTPHLIVAQQKHGRWYVYFQGVLPKENVGCGCKTAKSAIKYMYLLKHRYGAVISRNVYDRIKADADKEA